MKVAIIGAGLSGLSCAITLEKRGINPTVFEKRSCVGDRFVNAEAMFSILERPVRDGLTYLSEEYGIHLEPISEVNPLIIHSKNQKSSVNGKIGDTNIRGRHEKSFECQLARQVKSEIIFNFTKDYTELAKDFDSIVLATGDGDYSIKVDNYRSDVTCSLKGATVVGTFLTAEPHVWFNYDIIPKGYAWLIPYSSKEANLVIAFPEYAQTKIYDIDKMWELFFDLACRDLRQELKITDRFQIRHYMMGICNSPKIGNTYFVGNCFGTISPGLGFGQFSSMLTGIYAALDICGEAQYSELVKPLFENYNHSLALRRFIEGLNDNDFDRIVKDCNYKFIDKTISRLFSSHGKLDLLKWVMPFLSK